MIADIYQAYILYYVLISVKEVAHYHPGDFNPGRMAQKPLYSSTL